jgi:hypothetical protein
MSGSCRLMVTYGIYIYTHTHNIHNIYIYNMYKYYHYYVCINDIINN